jgi:hypothetical protein
MEKEMQTSEKVKQGQAVSAAWEEKKEKRKRKEQGRGRVLDGVGGLLDSWLGRKRGIARAGEICPARKATLEAAGFVSPDFAPHANKRSESWLAEVNTIVVLMYLCSRKGNTHSMPMSMSMLIELSLQESYQTNK